jgi:hypothetical protein
VRDRGERGTEGERDRVIVGERDRERDRGIVGQKERGREG